MITATRPLRLTAVAVCAAFLACGGNTPVQPRVADRLEVVGGANQLAAVGSALPLHITVKTSDAQGPVGGVTVSATTEAQGGGTTSPTSVVTAANGQADIVWTLGSKLGTQVLTLSAGSIPAVSVTATGQVGNASVIVPVSDAFQLVVVQRIVTSQPSVRVTDGFGNPVAGVAVTFDTPVPGSVLTGTNAVTNASGIATIGSWTIGPDAMSYSVRAVITSGPAAGAATVFEARGTPASLAAVGGNGQTGNTGSQLAQAPAVRAARDDGSPLANVPITFTVTAGGGTVQGTGLVTGLDGIARAGGWIMGSGAGPNQLTVTALGVPPVIFSATAVQGVPTAVTAGSPTSQTVFLGNFVSTPPTVVLTDAQSRAVAGVPVTFELQQSSGQIVGATQISDPQGRATLPGWRVGNGGSETVRAVTEGLPPVVFTANTTPAPSSTFKLEVRFIPGGPDCTTCLAPSPAQTAAFTQAAERWKAILIAGQQPYPINEQAGVCGPGTPAINETVDGLLIFAKLRPIDGVNNILGQSFPCIVRDDHGFLPALGVMEFDTADLDAIQARGQLNDVILHEMGHVLGFGTMWDFNPGPPLTGPNNPPNNLLNGRGGADPTFTGLTARGSFLGAAALGTSFTGRAVPVENHHGPGTQDSHWREEKADLTPAPWSTELMTGFISGNGVPNPLSAFTIGSFRDLGYVVNDAEADTFTFQAAIMAAAAPGSSQGFWLNEGGAPYTIIVIDRHGRHVAAVPRM